jgi:hypothetical protein
MSIERGKNALNAFLRLKRADVHTRWWIKSVDLSGAHHEILLGSDKKLKHGN